MICRMGKACQMACDTASPAGACPIFDVPLPLLTRLGFVLGKPPACGGPQGVLLSCRIEFQKQPRTKRQ